MGQEHNAITADLREWIARQKVFFVSSAPLAREGLVNCSPKGIDTFRVLGPLTVAYLDLTGSGVETIAHLRENGRITIMMCAFDGGPKVLRLYGKGVVFEKGSPEYAEYLTHFEEYLGARAIILIDLHRIIDSCGYSIPLYDYVSERDILAKWSEKKGEAGVHTYNQANNLTSLDGLPGLTPDEASARS